MSELIQQPRQSTLQFVEDVKVIATDFKIQAEDCTEQLAQLKEKTNLLASVYESMEFGMPREIAARILNDFEKERTDLVEKQNHCHNNYGYYRKLADSLEEAITKF